MPLNSHYSISNFDQILTKLGHPLNSPKIRGIGIAIDPPSPPSEKMKMGDSKNQFQRIPMWNGKLTPNQFQLLPILLFGNNFISSLLVSNLNDVDPKDKYR